MMIMGMHEMAIRKVLKKIHEIHDIDVNQKYGEYLPYSFHLEAVHAQGMLFIDLLNTNEGIPIYPTRIVRVALTGHDLIEDARHTYNDIIELLQNGGFKKSDSIIAADAIFSVTDCKGKSRKERKNEEYYKVLIENELGVFIKLADMAANRLFSKLTNSKQYKMYSMEFPKFRARMEPRHPRFESFFNYIESI